MVPEANPPIPLAQSHSLGVGRREAAAGLTADVEERARRVAGPPGEERARDEDHQRPQELEAPIADQAGHGHFLR